MRFWDSSAVVPLLLQEPESDTARALLAEDSDLVTWWATGVECTSAIARRERAGALDTRAATDAQGALGVLIDGSREVPPTGRLRDTARRIVRIHDLRAPDAFQLAAACEASDGLPATLSFVVLDERLAVAARREGFPVLP